MTGLTPSPAVCTFLAFDYGLKRVGVATGNSFTRQAQPLQTITAEGDARFARIGQLLREWQPTALVVWQAEYHDGRSGPGAWGCWPPSSRIWMLFKVAE